MHSSLLFTQNQGRVLQNFALRRLAAPIRGHRTVAGVQVQADVRLHLVNPFPVLLPRPHFSPLIVIPPEDMGRGDVGSSWALNTTSFIQVAVNSVHDILFQFHVPCNGDASVDRMGNVVAVVIKSAASER